MPVQRCLLLIQEIEPVVGSGQHAVGAEPQRFDGIAPQPFVHDALRRQVIGEQTAFGAGMEHPLVGVEGKRIDENRGFVGSPVFQFDGFDPVFGEVVPAQPAIGPDIEVAPVVQKGIHRIMGQIQAAFPQFVRQEVVFVQPGEGSDPQSVAFGGHGADLGGVVIGNRISYRTRSGVEDLQSVVRAEIEPPVAGFDPVDLATGESVVRTIPVYFVPVITEQSVVGSQPDQSVSGAGDGMDGHGHVPDGDIFPEEMFRSLDRDPGEEGE